MVYGELTTLLPLLASDAWHRGAWKKRTARKFADLLAGQTPVTVK
jgi:deoxyhypusine synthase